jgi:hypothetical protein
VARGISRRSLSELVLSAIIILLAAFIFWQHTAIVDRVTVWRYQPAPEIVAIADDTDMSETGRFYFYASRPSLLSRDSFNRHCTNHSEQTIVLGCYTGRLIYIYNVNDSRLPYIEEVTAAHEMLHAVYERLSSTGRDQVNAMIDRAMNELNDDHILALIDLYRDSDPEHLHNEMHSILGTEASELPAELEEHYARYFNDRSVVVSMADQYKTVFNDLRAEQRRLSRELADMGDRIDARNLAFEADVAAFERRVDSFNQKARSGGFGSDTEYDTERAALEREQASLEAERAAINRLINTYNDMRKQLQDIVIETRSLNESIDSRSPTNVPEV